MKKVIVTGAAGNLGKAVVKNFLGRKYKIFACISMRDDPAEIKSMDVEIFSLDLTDAAPCKSYVEAVAANNSGIDAAVLTVGGFAPGNMKAASKTDFEKQIALNFYTAFNMVQPLFEQMEKQPAGGKIILIGSEPGKDGAKAKGSVAYGFSKSLVFRLAELINEEGKTKNISAHVIVPTTMDTPQNRAAMPNADFSKWATTDKIAEEIALALV